MTSQHSDHFEHISALCRKNIYDNPFLPERDIHKIYLRGIIDEIKEVQEEMRQDNAVYLEDELGDILWDYLMLVHALTKEGYITSSDHVLVRALTKYRERIEATCHAKDRDEAIVLWDTIKKKQKIRRIKEHEDTYPQA